MGTGRNVGEALDMLRAMGVVLGEGISVDRRGIVLELRVRASPEDLPPEGLPMFFAFLVDKYTALANENTALKEQVSKNG